MPSVPTPSAAGALPEDPVAGAKSAAQWREHLAHEERERRLGYDRRKLPEHREVLKALRVARQTYDRAGTERAVRSAEQNFRGLLPKLEQRFDAIDHWGNSSKVLPDYRTLTATLAESYPNARIAALAGDPARLAQVQRDVDATLASVDAWLETAENDEGEE